MSPAGPARGSEPAPVPGRYAELIAQRKAERQRKRREKIRGLFSAFTGKKEALPKLTKIMTSKEKTPLERLTAATHHYLKKKDEVAPKLSGKEKDVFEEDVKYTYFEALVSPGIKITEEIISPMVSDFFGKSIYAPEIGSRYVHLDMENLNYKKIDFIAIALFYSIFICCCFLYSKKFFHENKSELLAILFLLLFHTLYISFRNWFIFTGSFLCHQSIVQDRYATHQCRRVLSPR